MKLIPEINQDVLQKNIASARANGVLLPTFAQQKDPALVPDAIKGRLKEIGLWEQDPANLFRITWKNEPVEHGGGFGEGNWIEFPPALTGTDAAIVGIVGKWFPTGAHKVGAAYGCLVPRLVTGTFDADTQKAVWPSTGNYCRGGSLGAGETREMGSGKCTARVIWRRISRLVPRIRQCGDDQPAVYAVDRLSEGLYEGH